MGTTKEINIKIGPIIFTMILLILMNLMRVK